jgi:hypothetical protein
MLELMMEDREAARAERQANLATLQHLAQIATNHNNNGGNGDDEPRTKLRDFQNSNPPTFTKSTEPLDADDWLCTIENKLEYVGVGPNEKVLYATHFLAGAAGAWWENVRAMQPEDQVMTWDDFKTKFHKAHIPSGLIKLMRDKFLNLKQGSMNVSEYLDKFTSWGRYAPNDIDSDDKKKERFLNGLHEELQTYLVAVPYPHLETMVDAAIMVEDKCKAALESRKRRMMTQGGSSSQRSRSLPPTRSALPPPRFASQAPKPDNPNRQSIRTALEAEATLVATATMLTPITMAKEVTVIHVDSQDTSLRSALSRSQQHRASTCRSPPRAKAVDPHEEIRRTKPMLPEAV